MATGGKPGVFGGIVASLLMEHYEVDEDTARQDAKDLVDSWLEAGIVSE